MMYACMQEYLGEAESRAEYMKGSHLRRYVKRGVVNFVILGILSVALFVIQLTVVKFSEEDDSLRRYMHRRQCYVDPGFET